MTASQNPLISVIIPARDVAATIDNQLAALAAQDYEGEFEVVVADNGSTDDTLARVAKWVGTVPGLRAVDATGPRGCSYPRNVGAEAALGSWILFCDGDDIVSPGWVRCMARALEAHPIVTGRLELGVVNRPEQHRWMADDDGDGPPTAYGSRPFAAGGNMGCHRRVLDDLGGFTVDFTGGSAEDIDFSWRAQDQGLYVHYEPEAVAHYRLPVTARAAARRRFRRGLREPLLYRRHRVGGMRADPLPAVAAVYRRLLRQLPGVVVLHPEDRYQWAWYLGGRAGRLVGSVHRRTPFL